ncbi:MSCRAMM family adhesin SdrC [Occultella gossypii]|uniref:Uncharacterized protein n=1 Tax=Occultella gossypii TaxID=2800820 RepID=A0ABS7S3P4_9MICO|nr:MSCRAMM family adhesin SdrC [Occultella gossypii]MBZ2194518.1 hypothetical protein [Occultella gossypii]
MARHLVMAGRLMDLRPEEAYEHAQAALRRAGRVDIVREAVALTAYATGNYAEALRELRTVRRLSGIDAHRAIEADCERGLGRPERALTLAAAEPSPDMTDVDRVELAIVASGARLDLGEAEAALLTLDTPVTAAVADPELKHRLDEARVEVLRALGREDEADALAATLPVADEAELEDDGVEFAEVPYSTAELEAMAAQVAEQEQAAERERAARAQQRLDEAAEKEAEEEADFDGEAEEEVELDREPADDSDIEDGAESNPEEDANLDPESVDDGDLESDAEPDPESVDDGDLESDAEPDPESVDDGDLESDAEPDPEPVDDGDLESDAEPDPEPVDDDDLESDAEPDPEPVDDDDFETDAEPDPEPIDESESAVPTEAAEDPESKK